jgi:AcrR family transcriptional regulator
MADIAERAGITRVTLYRYYPDRDTIAFEIAVHMLQRIVSVNNLDAFGESNGHIEQLERLKYQAQAMIRNFDALRDAYRFIGMFDHMYSDEYPTQELAIWFQQQVRELKGNALSATYLTSDFPYTPQAVMVMSAIMSFLKQLAARTGLPIGGQESAPDTQLGYFDEMISTYLDQLIATLPHPNQHPT